MKVLIPTLIFTLCIQAHALSIRQPNEPLRRVIIPSLSFADVSLSDVAQTLAEEYVTHRGEIMPSRINFVVHPSCVDIKVSLDLERVTLSDVFGILRQIYGIDFSTTSMSHPDTIILTRATDPPILIHRLYDVLPSVFPSSQGEGHDVKHQFERIGVAFPQGATAYHFPERGKLAVYNTIANLDVLEKHLSAMNVFEFQTEISVRIVRVDAGELLELAISDPSPSNVNALVTSASTLFFVNNVSPSGKVATNSLSIEFGEYRKKDIDLRMSASVTPDGLTIMTSLQAQLVLQFAEHDRIEYNFNTSRLLYRGASALYWIKHPLMEPENAYGIALVMQVQMVDHDGRHLPCNRHLQDELQRIISR